MAQLTKEQKTFLQNIIDSKDFEKAHFKLLQRVVKETREQLKSESNSDRPPHPHGKE